MSPYTKEKPIIFNTEMVKAILEGRKTMTRRVVKPQPIDHISEVPRSIQNENDWEKFLWEDEEGKSNLKYCPYGQIGDVLWVRETWGIVESGFKDSPNFIYKASSETVPDKWEPSIFMPRFASRISLRITNIRVERLNEISRGDALREGFPFPNTARENEPVNWFIYLWESINGKDSWEQNYWVWVISFEVIK